MKNPINVVVVLCWLIFSLSISACNTTDNTPKQTDIVAKPERFEDRMIEDIKRTVGYAQGNKGRLNDTLWLASDSLVNMFYEKKGYQPIWCGREKWMPLGDSLYNFIARSKEYGLFPSDYHFKAIAGIRSQIEQDSVSRSNAALWTLGDLMLTDAFFQISRHLKHGHLKFDSVTLRTDSILNDSFYINVFNRLQYLRDAAATFHELEPRHPGYDSLKEGLKTWLDSVGNFRRYTYLKIGR